MRLLNTIGEIVVPVMPAFHSSPQLKSHVLLALKPCSFPAAPTYTTSAATTGAVPAPTTSRAQRLLHVAAPHPAAFHTRRWPLHVVKSKPGALAMPPSLDELNDRQR